MKKTSIYSISLFIGLILGILIYSIVRIYFPNEEEVKTDYILFDETKYNLSNFQIEYSLNIDENMTYNTFMKNVMYVIDSDEFAITKYYKHKIAEDEYVEVIGEYNFDRTLIDDAIKSIYGPDYEYNYESFKYTDYYGVSSCKYEITEEKYYCSSIYTDEENDLSYELYPYSSTISKENDVVTKYYIYYLKYGCSGEDSVCLYSDPQKKHLITEDFNKSEISSYFIRLTNFTVTFSKASDNKYYLKTIKW